MAAFKLLYLLIITASGCNILSTQTVKQVTAQKTFATLSMGEKYAYLSAVLKAQRQVINGVRIARVKSLAETITHKGDLTVQLIDNGFQRPKLIRVSWSKVQADSIELLRCKLKNLQTNATVPAEKIIAIADGYDFDKLQTAPNSYGFLDCQRVYGRIQNGVSIIDYGAENKFSYVYFFRPCYKNYTMVVPATTGSDTKQCGEDKIAAAQNDPDALAATAKHALVFRYCQADTRQVCSSVLRHNNSNPIDFNHGVKELPLHLFEQLHALRAKIQTHQDAIYKEGGAVLAKLTDETGIHELDSITAAQEKLDELQETHDLANTRRVEKAESIAKITAILDQEMAETLGHDMSFRGRNCYVEDKEMQENVAAVNQELKQYNEQLSRDYPQVVQDQQEFEEIELEWWMRAMSIGECVTSTGLALGKLVKVEGLMPFDNKKFKLSKQIGEHHDAVSTSNKGAKFGNQEWGLAAANFAVDMIPLETSELNRGDGIAAFAGALNSIFMGEDTYTRSHCKACLDHMAQLRYHYRAIYRLQQELKVLSDTINAELIHKGAVDPHAQ